MKAKDIVKANFSAGFSLIKTQRSQQHLNFGVDNYTIKRLV